MDLHCDCCGRRPYSHCGPCSWICSKVIVFRRHQVIRRHLIFVLAKHNWEKAGLEPTRIQTWDYSPIRILPTIFLNKFSLSWCTYYCDVCNNVFMIEMFSIDWPIHHCYIVSSNIRSQLQYEPNIPMVFNGWHGNKNWFIKAGLYCQFSLVFGQWLQQGTKFCRLKNGDFPFVFSPPPLRANHPGLRPSRPARPQTGQVNC